MKRLTRIITILMALLLVAAPALAFDNLKRGDRGTEVQELQTRLNELGYSVGTPDGIFGGMSEEAVKSFQQDNGLEVTGEVDEATWNKLFGDGDAAAEAATEAAEESGEATIQGVTYERVPDVEDLAALMDPIMKYVDPAADGANGFDGQVCVNMYYGLKMMRWYHLYLDAGDQNNLAQVASTIMHEASNTIIVHSLDEGAKEKYPEMKEKFAAALAAAKLAFDESAAPYLDELGIAPADNWMEAEVDLMNKATMTGFDAILNQ